MIGEEITGGVNKKNQETIAEGIMDNTSFNHSHELLEKILEQERKLGYTNRAVIGGLDKFIVEWARPFGDVHPDFSMRVNAIASTLKNYDLSSTEDRKRKLDSALSVLRGESISTINPSPSDELFASLSPRQSRSTLKPTIKPQTQSYESKRHYARRNKDDKKVWLGVGIVAVFALVYFRSRAPNTSPKDPIITAFQIILSIGLIYLIYRASTDPYQSKPGERTWLYHGGIVSARWKEKQDRQGCLFWLWAMLIVVLISIVQN